MKFRNLALATVVAALSCSCIAHKQYRTDYSLCPSTDPAAVCAQGALHAHQDCGSGDEDYFLGFIEFDDGGQLWDRRQASAVLGHLQEQVGQHDLLLVVFVHGWKHSAAPQDGNIEMFRRNLALLSGVESRISAATGTPERKVAGIYLGWRGGSISAPVLKQLTFWDRKNTAHKVGHGGVTEVLARVEELRGIRGAVADTNRTRVIVIGHSFGGAVVYSALGQLLEQRFVETTAGAGAAGAARGFGDLVVLINPAFEAQRYATLSDMSTERNPYFGDQLPVLAILTSEGDDATGKAFPIGRFFSTLFEKERTIERLNGHTGEIEEIDQHRSNVIAVGHFGPYRTHRLEPTGRLLPDQEAAYLADAFFGVAEAWENDLPGGSIEFPGTRLDRRERCAARNPYLVIEVSEDIIPDHNQIDDPRVVKFLTQLILLSSQDDDPKVREALRRAARAKN